MQTTATVTPAPVAPGVYTVPVRGRERRYVVQHGEVRYMRAGGQVGRELAGRVTARGVQPVAPAHRAAVVAIAAGRATLVAAHCTRCGRALTDPESVARQLGPECEREVIR